MTISPRLKMGEGEGKVRKRVHLKVDPAQGVPTSVAKVQNVRVRHGTVVEAILHLLVRILAGGRLPW